MKIQKLANMRHQNFGDTMVLLPEGEEGIAVINRFAEPKPDAFYRTEGIGEQGKIKLLLITDGNEKVILKDREACMRDLSCNHTGHYTGVYLETVMEFAKSAIEQGRFATVKTLDDIRKLPKWGEIVKYMT